MTVAVTRESLLSLIGLAERDHRAGLAKLTELRAQLANLPIPNHAADLPRCPICGITNRTERQINEHVWVVHNASDPALDPQRHNP